MSEHASLSPSGSGRWMTCPGSVPLIEQVEEMMGPEKSGPWAAAGSAAHALAERCLTEQCTPDFYIGQVIYTDDEGEEHVVDQAMCDKIEEYVDYVNGLEGDLYVEQKVTLAPSLPEIWGTADAVVCQPGHLVVTDLKTGYNIVDAVENTQLIIYAIGAFIAFDPLYDFETITVVISQPPVNHHSSWDLTKVELMEWAAKVRDAAKQIRAGSTDLVPSDKACQWCRARAMCPALAEEVEKESMLDYKGMKAQELAEALDRIPLMKAWISGVEDTAKELALQGTKVPTYKVVAGRKNRSWKDEGAAIKYLRKCVKAFKKTCYTEKFKTVAQIEKALKKAEFNRPVDLERLIDVKEGAPTLVPETDRRKELVLEDLAAQDFAEFKES